MKKELEVSSGAGMRSLTEEEREAYRKIRAKLFKEIPVFTREDVKGLRDEARACAIRGKEWRDIGCRPELADGEAARATHYYSLADRIEAHLNADA